MRTAVCPGSFDPVTNGHLDVFARASEMADEVIVAVLINKTKSSLFTVEERIEMLEETVAPLGNVRIDSFHGLLVDYCRDHGIKANYRLAAVETLFISTNPLYSYISSSLIKEVATYGGDVSGLLPDPVLERLTAKISATLGK
jgi:pantetheine-phosphate adenylyltransferase